MRRLLILLTALIAGAVRDGHHLRAPRRDPPTSKAYQPLVQ